MKSANGRIDGLNSLLRGELAATETYQQAMDKMAGDPAAVALRQVRDEHRESANMLRQHVHHHGGKPEQDSGAWGVWAKLVEGGAKLVGNTAALKALKEGEEHGLKTYEAALDDDSLPVDTKTLIRSTLVPQTRGHISVLDRMLNL
jgi:uncharacterized protein (TIGR02284 family)